MPDQSFSKAMRVRAAADFRRVYDSDVYAADGVLVVCATKNELPHARLGLSVSRAVGNAVMRTRWKRRIREAFRLTREQLPTGIDFVVRPKKGASPDFAAIRDSLPKLAARVAKKLAQAKV